MASRRRRRGASRNDSAPPSGEERRWKVPLLSLFAAALLYGGVQWFLESASLPVNTVRIETPLQQVTPEQLREVVGSYVSTGFLRVDVERIRAELEAMPWVKRASVRRGWPDRIEVRIEEQLPMARWAGGGLVNVDGKLFRPDDNSAWDELPLLRGPQGTEQAMAKGFIELQGMLTPLGLQVTHLTMNERRSWDLRLDNGLRLGLGKTDVNLRLLRFVRVFAETLKPQLHAIDSVDLRYTNGFAVRWRDGHSPAAV